jgi:hypothetical protein
VNVRESLPRKSFAVPCGLPNIPRRHVLAILCLPTMITTPPCPDCIDLVGAAPAREPHGTLIQIGKNSEERTEYRCATCAYGWAVGRLGWSAVTH